MFQLDLLYLDRHTLSLFLKVQNFYIHRTTKEINRGFNHCCNYSSGFNVNFTLKLRSPSLVTSLLNTNNTQPRLSNVWEQDHQVVSSTKNKYGHIFIIMLCMFTYIQGFTVTTSLEGKKAASCLVQKCSLQRSLHAHFIINTVFTSSSEFGGYCKTLYIHTHQFEAQHNDHALIISSPCVINLWPHIRISFPYIIKS